jgi:hypothetical protein
MGVLCWRTDLWPDLSGMHVHLSGDVTLGELIVGVGTLALAGFTWRLARQARREVDSTRESINLSRQEIQLTRQSIEAQDRPFVIPTPPPRVFLTVRSEEGIPAQAPGDIKFERVEWKQLEMKVDRQWRPKGPVERVPQEQWMFVFRLWNMGKGPAIVTGVFFDYHNRQLLAEPEREILIHAPDGASDQRWPLESPQQPPESNSDGLLRITYRDSAGVQYRTSCRVEVDDKHICQCLDFVQIRLGEG